jgi:RNA polymerase sigma-70 factor (ECF subfamily)
MSAEPLDRLLDRLGQGDEQAAEQIIADYEPFLRLMVRRYFPDRIRGKFDSADVVQSVWIHVLAGLRAGTWQFADTAHLKAFLVRVARRRLVSRYRHHHGALDREHPGPVDLDQLPTRVQSRPSEEVQAEELWQKMLALCPPPHREVLRLRRQGLLLDEISQRTGLHEGSVRRILRRVARQLALEQEPFPTADVESL